MRVGIGLLAVVAAVFELASPATATPVATSDQSYGVLGRVFPDPLAGCTQAPCPPDGKYPE